MRVEPLGDSAFILRELEAPSHQIANALNASKPPGLIEAVASYDTVGLFVDPGVWNNDDLDWIVEAVFGGEETASVEHSIPVCYNHGEDMAHVCSALSLSEAQVVELHTSEVYTCFAIGFCPGFPYLGYLAEALRGIPRRPTPRLRVEPGSVAITGDQTSIYPLPRPGGWALIGKTPLTIVDPETGYFPIKAGDRVRFCAIDSTEFDRIKGGRL